MKRYQWNILPCPTFSKNNCKTNTQISELTSRILIDIEYPHKQRHCMYVLLICFFLFGFIVKNNVSIWTNKCLLTFKKVFIIFFIFLEKVKHTPLLMYYCMTHRRPDSAYMIWYDIRTYQMQDMIYVC